MISNAAQRIRFVAILSAVIFLNLFISSSSLLSFHLASSPCRFTEKNLFIREPVIRLRAEHFSENLGSNNTASFEIQKFATEIQRACHTRTLVSFTLLGPTLKTPRNEGEEEWKNIIRGRIRSVQGRIFCLKAKKKRMPVDLKSAVAQGEREESLHLQVTLKYHGATDVAQNWKASSNHIREGLLEIIERERMINEKSSLGIQRGELITKNGSWILNANNGSRTFRFKAVSSKPQAESIPEVFEVAPHDRPKNFPLPPDSPFFIKLGVSNTQGKPRPGMESKLRQCQHFVETVYGLVEETIDKSVTMLTTVDMGCGRGYLTFALHAHLSSYYDVNSYGVEIRPKLVQEINTIASDLGTPFQSLQAVQGSIDSFQFLGDKIDVLIALHACDTATDDAIFFGVKHGAKVIVTAPCCHKEVRNQLDCHFASSKNIHPYKDVLRHPIYRERIAESVTDSVRALLLEIAGYNVKVFEFIGNEHTMKNVMIAATKRVSVRSPIQLASLQDRLIALTEMHGIQKQKLASLMAEKVWRSNEENKPNKKQWARYMPPINESRI